MVKIVPSSVPLKKMDVWQQIIKDLEAAGFNLISFRINRPDYDAYLSRANYGQYEYYECGKGQNFAEKSLEHYVAAKLLHLNIQDVYIDIANSNSPAPQIYSQLFGCKSYRQDLIFPEGINGYVIGGDASKLPVSNEFASAMALHCSFEHFENDTDIRFIQEASRVLKLGGRLCILPLYLYTEYAIQTDLAELPKDGMIFDDDAAIYFATGWKTRHGRYYDVAHLISRVKNNLNNLNMSIYHVENAKEINETCYLKFAMLIEKPKLKT